MKTLLTLAQMLIPMEDLPPNSNAFSRPALCAPLNSIHEQLNKIHSEKPILLWNGEENDPRQGILYYNKKSKSVTFVLALPNDQGCVVSSGKAIWESESDEENDEGRENTKDQQS